MYGHKKKVCLEQNISIGSIHASFHNFHNVSVYMYMKWPLKLVMWLKIWQIRINFKTVNLRLYVKV